MEFITSAGFSGMTDGWTEHLFFDTTADGGLVISSQANVPIGDLYDLGLPEDDEGERIIPELWKGKPVHVDQGYLVYSDEYAPTSDASVATFQKGEAEDAIAWMVAYGWGGGEDWPLICEKVRIMLAPCAPDTRTCAEQT